MLVYQRVIIAVNPHLPHHLAPAGGPGGDLEGAQSALEQINAMPSLATAAGGRETLAAEHQQL